jgi:hypothetical protein
MKTIRLSHLVIVGGVTLAALTAPIAVPQWMQPAAAQQQSQNSIVNRVRVYPRAGFASRLKGAKIQGSNQNATSGFINLATIGDVPDNQWIEIGFANTAPYKYLRLFTPNESWANVAELEFYNGNTKISGQPYGTFGSRDNSGNSYDKAFDGSIQTFFDAPIANAQYLGIELVAVNTSTLLPTTPIQNAAGKTRRHYHIGNSLTDTIGEFMQAKAKAAGYSDDFFDRQTIPGSPLSFNWKSDGGFGTNHKIAFVKNAPLTDLVMQAFIDNGDSQDPTYSLNLYDLAKQNSPQVQPWIYAQWPSTGNGGKGSPDWEERAQAYMRTYVTHKLNFQNARPDSGIDVVPGGLALINLKRAVEAGKVPGMTDFFAANFDDDIHVSSAGRYFIGLVHFATLYKQNPVGLPLVGINNMMPKLTPEQTKAYQQVAWDTVTQWNQNGDRNIGVSLPAHIDARSRVGSTRLTAIRICATSTTNQTSNIC